MLHAEATAHVAPAQLTAAQVECLDENTILDFVTGRLAPDAISQVEDHLDGCDRCQMLLSCAGIEERQAETSSPWPQPGQCIGDRFHLIEWLGCGATGVVFAARDAELDVEVAIKLLRWDPRRGSSKERQGMLACLRREILVGRRIAHPNVCRVYDFGSSDGYDYITMALVRGKTLAEVMKEPIETERATAILDAICSALAVAHQQGVIHRDLKPTNIMVDNEGVVTVMDFGLALDALSPEGSREGRLVGTPAYWAPEQLRGAPASVATDLHALGIIAFELLSGQPPSRLAGRNALALVPAPFRRALRKCLSDDIGRRPASAAELQRELRVAARLHRHRHLGRAVLGLMAVLSALALTATACTGPTTHDLRLASIVAAPTFGSSRAAEATPASEKLVRAEAPSRPVNNAVNDAPRGAPRARAAALAKAPPVDAPRVPELVDAFVVPVLE